MSEYFEVELSSTYTFRYTLCGYYLSSFIFKQILHHAHDTQSSISSPLRITTVFNPHNLQEVHPWRQQFSIHDAANKYKFTIFIISPANEYAYIYI